MPRFNKDLRSDAHSLAEKLNPDRALLALITRNRKQFLVRAAVFFTKIGNGQVWFLFSLIVFLYSVPHGVAFLMASMFQLHIQLFLKTLIKRARPYRVYRDLTHFYDPPDPYSFPSGHTAAAFAMFFTARIVIPSMWPFFLLVGLSIAVSRIYLAVHYPSDVFAGILIGYLSATFGIIVAALVTGTVL